MVEFQWHSVLALLVFLLLSLSLHIFIDGFRYGSEHLDSYKISIEYMLIY